MAAAVQSCLADRLHSESRLTPGLSPQHGHVLLQDWQPPPVPEDFDRGSPPHLSGQPWWEELRDSLSRFKSSHLQSAPARHRAFYSALRTLLAEIAADDDPASQAARLRAAHTWWAKHRPRERAGNPAASAALAASLAIPASSLTPRTGAGTAGTRLVGTGMGMGTGAGMGTGVWTSGPADPQSPVPQTQAVSLTLSGTKHEFFAAFTKAATPSPQGAPQGSLHTSHPGVPSSSRRGGRAAGPSPAAPAAAHLPVSRLAAVQTHVSGRSMHGSPRSGTTAATGACATTTSQQHKQQQAAVASSEAAGGAQGPLQAGSPALPPRYRARVVFNPDRLEAASGPTHSTQGKAPSWFQGPFRAGADTALRHAALPGRAQGTCQDAEEGESEAGVAALRRQQAAAQQTADRAAANVERAMHGWSERRARLEEEMVRRQEASRYALPSTRHAQHPAGEGGGDAMYSCNDEVSAYAGVTREVYNSLAAGHQDLSAAPDALRLVPGLAPPPTTAAVAQAERAQAAHAFEHEALQIAARMQQLGIVGAIRPAAMLKALGPVPDRPYLDCLAKLPRPGEHLPSRPGSVSGARTRRKGEAGAKRPASGG